MRSAVGSWDPLQAAVPASRRPPIDQHRSGARKFADPASHQYPGPKRPARQPLRDLAHPTPCTHDTCEDAILTSETDKLACPMRPVGAEFS
jgi:hypothetical protein